MGQKKMRLVAGSAAVLAAITCGMGTSQARAATYAGNGATGFGGPVGQGSLSVNDAVYTDANGVASPGVNFAFTTSAGHPSGLDTNNLAIYLSTGSAGGLTDTRSLIDTGNPPGTDNGHTAISGYNNFNNGGETTPTRTAIAFPTGFAATYAFSFANAFDGLFKLPTDGSGLLTYVTGVSPVNANNTITVPLTALGLTAGQTFSFVATDIDGSAAYRSNEAIGGAATSTFSGTTQDLAAGGNPGFNNSITFSSSSAFTTATPEPATLGVFALGGALALRRRRPASAGV